MLVTTLTKKMAEDLTDYLLELGVRVRYLHSEVDTIQRIEILRDLRLGEFDVLVGINLLREGLDLPEVSLVAILDADKEGFLRSETSLIQTIGRAARNVDGQVIMYADKVTDSMQRAISETNRRRGLQEDYNAEHGIDPQTIRKAVTDILVAAPARREARRCPGEDRRKPRAATSGVAAELAELPQDELARLIQTLEEEMHEAVGRPPLRVRGPPARRDQGPQARAARGRLILRPSRISSGRARLLLDEDERRTPCIVVCPALMVGARVDGRRGDRRRRSCRGPAAGDRRLADLGRCRRSGHRPRGVRPVHQRVRALWCDARARRVRRRPGAPVRDRQLGRLHRHRCASSNERATGELLRRSEVRWRPPQRHDHARRDRRPTLAATGGETRQLVVPGLVLLGAGIGLVGLAAASSGSAVAGPRSADRATERAGQLATRFREFGAECRREGLPMYARL